VVSPAAVIHDPELGAIKAPGVEVLRTYEGFSRYITDAYGFNNDEIPKQLSARRILLIGDSFVEAEQVQRSENFAYRLNQYNNTFVYNAGLSGADPSIFPVILQRFQPVVQPTQLVIFVNSGDLMALSSDQPPRYEALSGLKKWLQPVFASSALMTHLNWKYKPEVEAWLHTLISSNKVEASRPASLGLKSSYWHNILVHLKSKGIPILVVVMPSITYQAGGAEAIISPASIALVEVARGLNIDVIRTEEEFVRNYEQTKCVSLGFSNSHLGRGHLNANGHKVMEKIIAKQLGMLR